MSTSNDIIHTTLDFESARREIRDASGSPVYHATTIQAVKTRTTGAAIGYLADFATVEDPVNGDDTYSKIFLPGCTWTNLLTGSHFRKVSPIGQVDQWNEVSSVIPAPI